MQKKDIIKIAKIIKSKLKGRLFFNSPYVSYARRIERIKTNKRICAMTFDDGPTAENNLTNTILDVLSEFSAKGTFDVIGTTENNYPDKEGIIGTPSWSGTFYDHYPRFEKDHLAGAVNCPELIKRIINEGHEITNHTYSHVLFGKKNIIYSSRKTLISFDDVFSNVEKLHLLLKDTAGYEMKFSRPPHYVDKIEGKFTSFDVYSLMGYNYLAASFDGAGWLPCEKEEDEINAMVLPLANALKENPDALSGQIIFQKDGYNMALRAPVMKGLKKQLELLKEYGYEVVTVSELLRESPFFDVGRDDPDFELFESLEKDRAIAFSNNCLYPDALMTRGELSMLIAPKAFAVDKRIKLIKEKTRLPYSLAPNNPYSSSMLWAFENALLSPINKKAHTNKKVSIEDFEKLAPYFDIEKLKSASLTRRNILKALKI